MAVPNGANDPREKEEASGSASVEEKNMIEIMILAALYCVLAAKKKTVFGQMTLRSTKALEYLKTTPEPIKKTVMRFTWIHKVRAEVEDWELPDWVMANEKYDWVCILDVVDGLPFLVYQKSALRQCESILMRLEANGAKIETKHKGQVLTVDLGDDTIEMSAWRNPNGGKFAPFNVQFEGVVGK
jgi:hypothetical protein